MTDTDGIYDRCQCGELAVVEYSETYLITRAVCKSCGAATRWHLWSSSVMVEWNRYQRNIDAKINQK
jgi:transcription elongation factor Elf1